MIRFASSKNVLRHYLRLLLRERPTRLAVLVTICLGVLVVVGVDQLTWQQRETSNWVEHTFQVLLTASTVKQDVALGSAEGRAFALDRSPESRLRMNDFNSRAGRDLSRLQALTADSGIQRRRVRELEAAVALRLAALQMVVDRASVGDQAGVLALVRTHRGRILMDRVLSDIDAIQGEERHLLSIRTKRRIAAGEMVSVALIAAMTAMIVLLCAVLVQGRKLRAADAKLRSLVHQDPLTGLGNRRCFDSALDREWGRAQRHHTPLSLVMIDVDQFKAFNDRYGHQAGDACLRSVAAVIENVAKRATDVASRVGGEEFALLLPDANATGAQHVANKVRACIETMRVAHADLPAGGVSVTVSLGVGTTWPGASFPLARPTDLVSEADRYLYAAKDRGRNQVCSELIGGQCEIAGLD